jgi:hypothetical protein
MARTTKRASRPTRTRAKKAAAGTNGQAPEPVPDTQESLIGECAKVCDEVDALLADELSRETESKTRPLRFFPEFIQAPAWSALYDRRADLTRRLRELLEKEAGEDERVEVAQFQIDNLTVTEPGIVPTFGRPGSWIAWIGWSPIMVAWGGYMVPGVIAYAADPDRPWMHSMGHRRLEVSIASGETTPYQSVRRTLAYLTTATTYVPRKGHEPSFKMAPLIGQARAAAGARLAELPWLQAALKRGPTDAIPLPKHIKSVQMALA